MELAPTVLFVYARPWHTEQTLKALEQNTLAQDSILYIYADGAKENAPKEQLEKIQQVRQLIRQKWNFKEIHIVERDRNWGLADNIIDGVTGIVNKHGKIIVLEDDLVTSPYFLDYCNQGLDLYKDTQNVYAINAFQFPLPIDEFDTFLCPLATNSWGWATWADKWAVFERVPKYKNLIQQNEHLKRRFNFADYDYASMLDNPKSWAIRWYYSVFLRNGLGVFPTKSLAQNIGFDGSGTHSDNSNLSQEIFNKAVKIREKQVVDLHLYSILLNYFTEYKNTGVNFNIHTEKNKNMVLKQVLRALTPPILYNGLASTIMKLRSRAVTTTKKDTTQSPEDKPKIRERVLNSQSQNLNIYWDKQMAQILETWGEDHVWNEIQLLLCNQKGKVLDVACGTGTVIQLLQKFPQLDVFGCDISDLLIEKALSKNIPKEKLIVCDATNMSNYEDDFFDYSYSIGSLEHFTEQGIVDFIRENYRIVKNASFHQIPVSLSNKDEGWITPYQSYFNNSIEWWLEKFYTSYKDVKTIKSGWKDNRSIGMWFICTKKTEL